MKKMIYQRPMPHNFSWHQDFALALCRSSYGLCPYNSIKDGSLNCDAHVRGTELVADQQCEPGMKTQQQAIEYIALLNAQEKMMNDGKVQQRKQS